MDADEVINIDSRRLASVVEALSWAAAAASGDFGESFFNNRMLLLLVDRVAWRRFDEEDDVRETLISSSDSDAWCGGW